MIARLCWLRCTCAWLTNLAIRKDETEKKINLNAPERWLQRRRRIESEQKLIVRKTKTKRRMKRKTDEDEDADAGKIDGPHA